MVIKNKYRNGGVSLVAVIFGTLVMSLICLSFINAMRSGLAQNVSYTTSMAAYDAANTGMTDAHIAINECIKHRNGNPQFGFTRADCDDILRNQRDCATTIRAISKVVGIPINTENGGVRGVVNTDSNQFYTCVRIEALTTAYRGRLDSQNPIATIPLGAVTADGNEAQVAKVGISWYRNTITSTYDVNSSANTACSSSAIYGFDGDLNNRVSGLCAGKYLLHTRTTNEAPIIGVELNQSSANYRVSSLISDNDGLTTNHGFMMFAPTRTRNTHIYRNVQNGGVNMNFVGSADHALQSPNAARCNNTTYNPATGGSTSSQTEQFKCAALIELPQPRGGGNRDLAFSYIRLSLPHLENEAADFEIKYYDANGNELRFAETQYAVSVQGWTGDRVRRLSGFIGGVRNARSDILPDYSAVSSGSAEIRKCVDSAGRSVGCEYSSSSSYNEAAYESRRDDWEDRVVCHYNYYSGNDAKGNPIITRYSGNNLTPLVERPQHTPKETLIWSAEQAAQFLQSSKEHPQHIAFLLLLTYGMRRGEVLGTRWCDIDFANNLIHVRQQIDRVNGEIKARDLKTKNSRRTLPLLPSVRDVLLRLAEKRNITIPPFNPKLEMSIEGTIVLSRNGKPLEPINLNRCFHILTEKMGLPRIKIHAARHTAATILKDLNVPIKDVQLILGHATIATTLSIYQHGTAEAQRSAMSALEKCLQMSKTSNFDSNNDSNRFKNCRKNISAN